MVGKKVELETKNIQEKGRKVMRKLIGAMILFCGIIGFNSVSAMEVDSTLSESWGKIKLTEKLFMSAGVELGTLYTYGADDNVSDNNESYFGGPGGSGTAGDNGDESSTTPWLRLQGGFSYQAYNSKDMAASFIAGVEMLNHLNNELYVDPIINPYAAALWLKQNNLLVSGLGLNLALGWYEAGHGVGGLFETRDGHSLSGLAGRDAKYARQRWADDLNQINPDNHAGFMNQGDGDQYEATLAIAHQLTHDGRSGLDMGLSYTAFKKAKIGAKAVWWLHNGPGSQVVGSLTDQQHYTLGAECSLNLDTIMKPYVKLGYAATAENTNTIISIIIY